MFNIILYFQKPLIVLCCIFITVSSVRQKEKKITLHDIEQDYVTTQKRANLSPPPAPKAQSPTQYGFVPVKTAANYVQQDAPSAFVAQYNQYATSQEQYPLNPQYLAQTQFSTQPDYSQYSTIAYSGDSTPTKYSTQDSSSDVTSSKYTQAKFLNQPAVTYAQNDYQNYENVQYVNDNSIAQLQGQSQAGQQQYYSPQYLYLQQYQAPSTSVQTVVDPKGE